MQNGDCYKNKKDSTFQLSLFVRAYIEMGGTKGPRERGIECELLKHQRKHSPFLVTLSQLKRTIVQSHDLTRKTESDAGAFLLGCVERHENLLLAFLADREAIVSDIDDDMLREIDFGCNLDVLRFYK